VAKVGQVAVVEAVPYRMMVWYLEAREAKPAQADRGGRGGRSGLELSGVPNIELPDGTRLWEYGRGGDGAGPPSKDDSEE
jgi:hypothetical protein